MRARKQHDGVPHGVEVPEAAWAASRSRQDAAPPAAPFLERSRRRHVILVALFAVILGLGVLQLFSTSGDTFPMVGYALVALGGINGAVNAGALRRVVVARRMHDADLRAPAAGSGEDPAFDQTNDVVDLGHDAEPSDPDAAANRARRLSSMNTAGIAYGNGTH